jgi:hypothetical protein
MIDIRTLSKEEKLFKIIEDLPVKFNTTSMRNIVFPEKELMIDELNYFFDNIAEHIGYILEVPNSMFNGVRINAGTNVAYSIDALIKRILEICEEDKSICYYNISIDTETTLNNAPRYSFRAFFYDDIGKMKRRERDIKISDILDDK